MENNALRTMGQKDGNLEASDITRDCELVDNDVAKIQDEFQNLNQTKLNTGSPENLADNEMNRKRKRSIDQTDSILNADLSDGNIGEGIYGKYVEKGGTYQVSEISVRKESSLSGYEVNNEIIIYEGQHPNQLALENQKPENGFTEVIDEIILYEGRCSAQGRSVFSTCDVEVTHHLSSATANEAEFLLGQYPRLPLFPSIKRKLIVLDVNGLLANIIMPAPKDCRGDAHILGRAIFKRPFCDDFLKFCFQNFDVGVWSSRSKKIIDRVVEYLLGDLKDKLLFCWDMSHSTQTGFSTLENTHKPLVFKELRRIWENDDPDLPWKSGDYNESNTLLLDDSPYKALLNPLHTAIFPNSYHYQDKNDNSLGPGGDLRVYLEGLLMSENVWKYVEQHPFGQSAINETSSSWGFYSGVLQTMSNRLQNSTPSSLPQYDARIKQSF